MNREIEWLIRLTPGPRGAHLVLETTVDEGLLPPGLRARLGSYQPIPVQAGAGDLGLAEVFAHLDLVDEPEPCDEYLPAVAAALAGRWIAMGELVVALKAQGWPGRATAGAEWSHLRRMLRRLEGIKHRGRGAARRYRLPRLVQVLGGGELALDEALWLVSTRHLAQRWVPVREVAADCIGVGWPRPSDEDAVDVVERRLRVLGDGEPDEVPLKTRGRDWYFLDRVGRPPVGWSE